MSDLQRSFAKAKISGLPFHPPPVPFAPLDVPIEDEAEEEYDEDEFDDDALRPLPSPSAISEDDSSSASSASSTGTIRPSASKRLFARPKGYAHAVSHGEWHLYLFRFVFQISLLLKHACSRP